MNKFIKYTTRLLIATAIIWVIYDIIALIAGGVTATISYVIWSNSKFIPFIPFGFGTLMGHFFSPDFFSDKIPRLRYVIWISFALFVLAISIKYYPIEILHPFLVFIIGIGNGTLWAQSKYNPRS
jgi:hypothetical protein